MKHFTIIPLCLLVLVTAAQRNKELGVAFTNSNSAMPFSKFGGLFQTPFHPGIEFHYGFNWKTKSRHDWYQQIMLGYFYHRFVQHGISLYTNFGYRYKFSSHFFSEASLGAGYLHSIVATAQLELNNDGEYKSDKGFGRMQAIVVFNLGAGYTFNTKAKQPVSIFAAYQQQVQTPFVKSYVPLLPYNSFKMGGKINLKKK
jgi:hypothetical protein